MAKVLLLIDNLFEDAEAIYPYYRMQEAGHKVTVVGSPAGEYHSKHGYPLKADKSPKEIRLEDYSAIIVPGGQAPDRMRTKADMVNIVKEGAKRGLVIAAICHAAQVLIEAEVVKGKRMTCYISVKTDLINAGAKYEDSPVVVDGKFITSRQPGDLPDFCKAIVGMVK